MSCFLNTSSSQISIWCFILPNIYDSDSIHQISTGETYFLVQFFLKSISEDPFEKYPVLQSSLLSQDLGQLVVVKPEDVESHFAGLSFEWHGANCLAVISLSQVFIVVFLPCLDTYLSYRNINFQSDFSLFSQVKFWTL